MSDERIYIAIDLKSFYASVECVDRGLDPLTTNLVVADESRTSKTICLAVSPSLKSYGISGRARLFEAEQRVAQVNADRRAAAPGRRLIGKSYHDPELKADKTLEIDFIVAPPRMARYMQVSTQVYDVYMRYVSAEDMHVYSVDEVFLDVTKYLRLYNMTPRQLAMKMIREVLAQTGVTATAGIGTNMYLCKIAMDIVAKHIPADKDGVRIAELDERSYRQQLWDHQPITDFWRVGKGTAARLAKYGMYTMGDIARCSIGAPDEFYNEELLYRIFGVQAELVIDHAWGRETTLIEDIKRYVPENNSLSQGQVLTCPYTYEKARIVVREMADALSLDLVSKGLVTDQMVLSVGYDIENLTDPTRAAAYKGEIVTDRYGRQVPKMAHGSINMPVYNSSARVIGDYVWELFDRIADPALLVRRMYVVANHVRRERDVKAQTAPQQLSLFESYDETVSKREDIERHLMREKSIQQAAIAIKDKFGKNAIMKGTNLQEGATGLARNGQIGGHKA